MNKMTFTDNQVAFDYAIYMIVGSYFAKAKCSNNLLEKKMHIQYNEQRLENQYRMEEICIRYMDKLLDVLPSKLWECEMQVKILPQVAGGSELQFVSDKYILRVKGAYRGRKSQLIHELWAR